MQVHDDADGLTLSLDAPAGGATARLTDGERTLWEGPVQDRLALTLGAGWPIPPTLVDLLQLSLPGTDQYSAEAFAALATPFVGLATLRFDGDVGRWIGPDVVASQLLPIPLMAGALHYAQSVFEGAKVFFVRDGDAVVGRMFRPGRNAARLWRSAQHMGIPLERSERDGVTVDKDGFERLFLQMVGDVVAANLRAGLLAGAFAPLDPSAPGFSWTSAPPALYLRPVLFASGPVLGVKPASHYTLGIYVTPVGKYRADLVLRVMRGHSRAWKGGTGAAKAACNYAPTLRMMAELKANKAEPGPDAVWTDVYDDLLFLGPDGEVEEMGGANFFVLRQEGERVVLRTPPCLHDDPAADTILPGITRLTVLELARAMGLDVVIGALPLRSITGLPAAEARRAAVFTTGTAATIAPVLALNDGGEVQRFAVWDSVEDPTRRRSVTADAAEPGSALDVARLLRKVLFKVQLGDEAGLRALVPDFADALIEKSRAWSRVFPVP